MSRVIKAMTLVIIAIAVIIAGNISRPYSAFGGEEMVAICMIVGAAYVLARRERKQ